MVHWQRILKFIDKNNESERGTNDSAGEGRGAPEPSLVHLSGSHHDDLNLQETATTTKRTQKRIGRDKVDNGFHTEMGLQDVGGVNQSRRHQDHGQRNHVPTRSPNKYYSQEVSFMHWVDCTDWIIFWYFRTCSVYNERTLIFKFFCNSLEDEVIDEATPLERDTDHGGSGRTSLCPRAHAQTDMNLVEGTSQEAQRTDVPGVLQTEEIGMGLQDPDITERTTDGMLEVSWRVQNLWSCYVMGNSQSMLWREQWLMWWSR